MAKKTKTIDEADIITLAQNYAKSVWSWDDYEADEITASDIHHHIADAFVEGFNAKLEDESLVWKKMAEEKPAPYRAVVCKNRKGEVAIGFYNKGKNGMVIYGYQIWGYHSPKDYGFVEEWRGA